MKMSTSTKRDGKPKLASGQILDDVMKSVDPWNGEPHGWLRGRIELVERAGPVVKVFVRLPWRTRRSSQGHPAVSAAATAGGTASRW